MTTRYERQMGAPWDPDSAVVDLNNAYAENGRLRPPIDSAYPSDLAFPNVAAVHGCRCGLRFQVRRDYDAHHCEVS